MKHKRLIRNLPKSAIYERVDTPAGLLTLIASDQGLHAILWEGEFDPADYPHLSSYAETAETLVVLIKTKMQLLEYFIGERKAFDLPLVISGTPFQQKAWEQLRQIPYGQTISYAEQAERMGDKKKARAVGMANGQNPFPIIIPCHRVIGKNGGLTGFGGGLEKKGYLLQLEKN